MKTIKILTFALLVFSVDFATASTAEPVTSESASVQQLSQQAESGEVTIDYARLVNPVDAQGFRVYMAAIGGSVQFEGTAPINVTLRIGGQTYTALTDRNGVFSFFVYANNSSRYEIEAWQPESKSVTLSSELVQK